MIYRPDDVTSWPIFKPTIIAHDVGRSRDRSTAVVGGNSPCGRRLLGIGEAEELPQNLFGSARASALAAIDRRYHCNALIVADLSNDATHAEVLLEKIGLQISRSGYGMNAEWRQTKHSHCRSTPSEGPICSNCFTPNYKAVCQHCDAASRL